MAQTYRAPTFAPVRRWNSAEAVRAQDEVSGGGNLLLRSGPVVLPGNVVFRAPTYAPIRYWNSAEAIRAQIYTNLLGTAVVSAPIRRNFDYSVQPQNKLSRAAIVAVADNYTNIVIRSTPSPIITALDYSVQPWNGRVSRAAVTAWADNYANRLASGFLPVPTAPIVRNFDYSVQPQNKLSAAAVKAWEDNYVNRNATGFLPVPGPLPPQEFDWPVYPPATKISSAAVNAWADNYVNRLASGFLPFVLPPPLPINRIPVPNTPITPGGPPMDRIWYRFFNELSRSIEILQTEIQTLKGK